MNTQRQVRSKQTSDIKHLRTELENILFRMLINGTILYRKQNVFVLFFGMRSVRDCTLLIIIIFLLNHISFFLFIPFQFDN